MASSDEDSVTDLSAPPPPGAGGVLKRLRALSYGSRGQFNEDDVQPAKPHPQLAQVEENPVDSRAEQVKASAAGPIRLAPAEGATGVEDFEAKYLDLQNKYIEVQRVALALQKEKDDELEKKFGEVEKLEFEFQQQQVELKKTRKENERLESELTTVQESLRQKTREVVQLKDQLIERGTQAMQTTRKYLALPAPKAPEETEQMDNRADPVADSKLKELLEEARGEISVLKHTRLQQDLQMKNLENELKHRTLDNEAKTKRQTDLLDEVQELRMSNTQMKKEVEVLEKEIELMLSEKWNSQHYSSKKHTDFDTPSESVRYKRLNETIQACKEEANLLRAQLREKEKEMAALSAALGDTRRMAKVTEDVLKKKICELRSGKDRATEEVGKVESSLKRSIDGLVKALEEQEDKTEHAERELKNMNSFLEAVDRLGSVLERKGNVQDLGVASHGHRELRYLPSSSTRQEEGEGSRELLVRRNIKKSRRKTIIPVLAKLPGSSSLELARPTSDQKFEVLVAIQQIPFLKAMDTSLQKELAAQARLTQCCAGDLLIEQGETGGEAYVLLEGILEIFTTIDEQEEVLKTVKPGAIIGEIALLKKEPRNTSVRSVTDSRLFVLEKQSLDTILDAHPEYRGGLEELANQRQKENQDTLKYKYALSTDMAAKEDIKMAILDEIITEPIEEKVRATQNSKAGHERDGERAGLNLDKRRAILSSCEVTLSDLYKTKEELLATISELDRASVGKVEEAVNREEALKEDLKNVNTEIMDIKNELFSTCKELEDRESELCAKDEELANLKGNLDAYERQKREEEEKRQKEKEDLLQLKQKYDQAAKAETDIIERTERLWSTINSKEQIEGNSYGQTKRDSDLIQKLKEAKVGMDSFQSSLLFLDGKTIPKSQDFNIVITPKSIRGNTTLFKESSEADRHVNNLRMIDDLIDQIN